ncbi:MAG: phosphomannomutase [Oceanospirillaceae bacterium]|uniref:phosphomannomutase/phosphoglucomutase n=1 Tax=unclassified Thalassolituus TaxID=2624967 RepID=UPI000C466687|nr:MULTISPECIES: phosphomannomutase/phosphoglucomutase [unclassified Thalassolituus]MAS24959.1 phosphomannomutase [Oceanospirillaceae bacterium]MBS53403.1 phosphomannomutase [Oceanospirillaceae bacterium]
MSSLGKKPARTIIYYSRISIWLALLFITGGMAVQSIQINLFTQSDVDKVFANAMAEQMAHSLSLRLQDTIRLQQAASNHPDTLNALENGDARWKLTLRQFMPGVRSLSLIKRNEAMGLQRTHGYAVQDLVSRTLDGAAMRFEAVTRDDSAAFYWASPIHDRQKQIVGVLLAEYGPQWLNQFQSGATDTLGQVVVNQFVDGDRKNGLEIFRAGQEPDLRGTVVTYPINDYWYLTYIPSNKRPQLELVPLITPWIVSLVATLLGLFLVIGMQKRGILQNQLKLLTYVRGLRRDNETPAPKFTLQLFHDLADSMHHLFSTMRPTTEDASQMSTTRQRVDLPAQPQQRRAPAKTASAAPTMGMMVEEVEEESVDLNPDIFRAYDIRGIAGKDLTDDTVYWIGRALGAELAERGLKKACIAWDGRLSSPALAQAVQKGLQEAGCNVIVLGAQPTGLMYFATHETDASSGVVITGSHNPAEFNGLKIVVNHQPLAGDELMALYHRIKRNDLPRGTGMAESRQLEDHYLERIEGDVQIGRDLKVVIDAGNGIAGPLAQRLFADLNIEAEYLYCDVDGHFPNHHPDPGKPENLATLQARVTASGADLGLAFDGDGDRLMVIDNTGKIIWPDRLLMLLVQDILPRNPGRDVIFDVKSSRHLTGFISRHGGRPTMTATGHSLMKRQMAETKAVVGGEFSGHIYIAERWYGFDDGLYTAARVLEILSMRSEPVSEVFAALPEDVSTPELIIETDDKRKFAIPELLKQDSELTEGARVFTTDGLRIEFSTGWGLIRPSNTTPTLTLRFAAQDEQTIALIQQKMKQALTRHAPELKVPF